MVVHGLQTYVETEIPEAMESSNLRELVNRELKYGRERPTIVFDSSAARQIFQSKGFLNVDWQPRIVKRNVEKFVESVISCGVDLITVVRGDCKSVTKWFYKRGQESIKEKEEFIAMLGKGIDEEEFKRDYVRTVYCFYTTLASIKNSHYKVFCAVDMTHKEVAEIAISQNCLAVIGQDSNYLIYDGIRNYISVKSLNTETLDCQIYSRSKMMEHLGLKSFHLPVFATLCGNDIIFPKGLEKFHMKISHPRTSKFLCIAEIIRILSDDPYKHINYILRLIDNPKIKVVLIKKSMDMYLNFEKASPINKWVAFANERKKACVWRLALYEIFISKTSKMLSLRLDDSDDLPPPSTLMRPLRGKIYGILFYDNLVGVDEYTLDEETIRTGLKSLVPFTVFPVKPVCEHPGLIQLFDEDTPNVDCIRWNLFCSSVSRTLKPFILRCIPHRLLLPVLALHYLEVEAPKLSGQKIFRRFEIEAFLVVALLVHEDVEVGDVDFDPLIKPDLRVLSLILYFKEACFTLEMLNQSCGLVVSNAEACFCNYFDGIVLHLVYKEMLEGAKWWEFFDGDMAMEAMFSSLMEIILN